MLTVGDLMGTFKHEGRIATQIAVNARAGIKVVTDATGYVIVDGTVQ